MSYAAQRGLSGSAPIGVGARAFSDPVLARASLDASEIMLAMAKAPKTDRARVMQQMLSRLGVGQREVVVEMRRGLSARENPDQVTFDALRMAIANTRIDRGVENLQSRIVERSGWDALAGLGTLTANDRATGCLIAAGTSTAGGAVSLIPGYGTLIGGLLSIGAGVAGGQLDCGREAREAAAAAEAAQARLAEAQATLANTQAEARKRRMRTLAGGGAILLAVLGAAWVILD